MNLPGRIVVLGGYGNFGARVSRALARDGRTDVVIAGRDLGRADRLAAELRREYPGSRVSGAELDLGEPRFVRRLGAIAPIVVVHAAGPFQGQDYRVAEACLGCRSHYVDLADGRDFVAGIGALDRAARKRDVLLVAGASTLPGLSSAIVDALTADLTSIRSIETAIVPAARSPRGQATVAAVLAYCGRAFPVLEQGRWVTRHGWLDGRTVELPLGRRRVAACDVPDLALFPDHYPGVETVTFHAGPELRWQHEGLKLMAGMTRLGLVRDWSRHARLLTRIDDLTRRFGSDIGGMRVRVTGSREGKGIRMGNGEGIARTWNLVARRNHGPEIPCVPAIVLAKRLLAGGCRARGAQACLGLVDLDDFAAEVAELDIDWSVTEEPAPCYPPT